MSWEAHSIATRERCGVCHRVSPVSFHVPDDLWRVAVPDYFRESIVCLTCFTSFADERLLAWDQDITFYPCSLRTVLRDGRGLLAGVEASDSWLLSEPEKLTVLRALRDFSKGKMDPNPEPVKLTAHMRDARTLHDRLPAGVEASARPAATETK